MTDAEYMLAAVRAARRSPDTSTQNGAILVPRLGAPVEACNRPPERLPLIHERAEAPLKYRFIEHAERTVILQAARRGVCTDGATLFCPWYACPECARAIVMAGICEVVGLMALSVLTPPRWRDDVKLGVAMLREAGVRTRLLDRPLGERIVFDGCTLEV